MENRRRAAAAAVISLAALPAAGQKCETGDLPVPLLPLPLQPAGAPFTEPAFGTSAVRVTSAVAQGAFGTPIYSQLQAFSAEGEYILLYDAGGTVVRRVADWSPVAGLDSSGWNVPRWHPVSYTHLTLPTIYSV